jgi:serine/threonine protein kinase
MALPAARILREGKTSYPWEQQAIDFVKGCLPNHDPYHLLALFEVQDPGTSRFYEIDLLVVGYSQLYLIECKGHPGLLEGDARDWYWTPDATRSRRYFGEHPLRLTNHKAKVVKGLLERKLGRDACPYVEALVFLSAPGVQTRFRDGGELGVVTRETIERAITRAEFPGSRLGKAPFGQRPAIAANVLRPLFQALRQDPAFRESKASLVALGHELGDVVREGPNFQERIARHPELGRVDRVARIYLVPEGSSPERAAQARQAAEREAKILWDLRDHEGILRAVEYSSSTPVGPAVLFDPFENGEPLDAFIRRSPDLSLDERVQIIERIGRALAFCHRKSVVHGALGPHSVLVRRDPETHQLETRLVHFHLGASADTSGTRHWTQLAGAEWSIYQAPELRESSARNPSVDVFGLGATAYFVLTGKPPAETGIEALRRLAAEKGFDPRAVLDDLDPDLATLVLAATRPSVAERDDDVTAWIELFVERARARPAPPPTGQVDPLLAREGDVLGDDLLVRGVLGQGATARVLEVDRDDETLALKVALEPRFDERLREEAAELRHLRHAHIVALVDERTISGRHALLLTVAGERTLQRALEVEGPASLELAVRYGEHLLSALEHLEEEGVLHRDIKPANLGVGASKKERKSLTLFDFSLSRAPLDDLDVGTSAYRDPYLPLRPVEPGQAPVWDAAADRWSAALTLHELLTGVRPHFDGKSPLDPSARVVIAAGRFDPSVRAGLLAFFEKALAPDVRARFESAERMRKAWLGAIDETLLARTTASPEGADRAGSLDEGAPSDDTLAAIDPATPIALLPLSTRARNALDRARLEVTGQLAALPSNQISALPGVGRTVQQEILALRTRWMSVRASRGLSTDALPLPRRTAEPTPHDARPIDARATDARSVEIRPDEGDHPVSLEGWAHALLGPFAPSTARGASARTASKRDVARHAHARALFGLEGPTKGRIDVSIRALAESLGVTPQAIYIALGKSRAAWRAHPGHLELVARVRALVAQDGGAATLDRLALALVDELPHDAARPPDEVVVDAAALVRVAAEVDASLSFVRLDGGAWIVAEPGLEQALRALGKTADELVTRAPLPTPEEAARVLRATLGMFVEAPVEGTSAEGGGPDATSSEGTSVDGAGRAVPFASLRDDRLLALAAEASAHAARSARLELYPRGFSPEIALEHSAPMLRGELTPSAVQELVRQRYPMAAPLPPRPELDRLLRAHGLEWHEARARYVRRSTLSDTSLHTRSSSSLHSQRSLGGLLTDAARDARGLLGPSPDEASALDFDEAVRLALELRAFRVLGVRREVMPEVLRAFVRRYDARLVWLDRLLIGAMFEVARDKGVPDLAILHRADAIGLDSPTDWARLTQLAQLAARRLPELVFAPHRSEDAPLLLAHPGLLARYGLADAAAELLERARSPETPPTFLALSRTDTTRASPTLGPVPRPADATGRRDPGMPVPGLLPAQILDVPRHWADAPAPAPLVPTPPLAKRAAG